MDNTFALNGLDFSPEINMARYLQSIRKFPILEQDEEFELATRYKETKDEKIAYKLVLRTFVWWLRSYPNIADTDCRSAK